jgi:hypothetical protein
MNSVLNLEQCNEIFEHNMKYLDSISISKSRAYEGQFLASVDFVKKGDDDISVKKYFYGKTITDLNEKITAFLNKEIKL